MKILRGSIHSLLRSATVHINVPHLTLFRSQINGENSRGCSHFRIITLYFLPVTKGGKVVMCYIPL